MMSVQYIIAMASTAMTMLADFFLSVAVFCMLSKLICTVDVVFLCEFVLREANKMLLFFKTSGSIGKLL